jgi:hypothetical protein
MNAPLLKPPEPAEFFRPGRLWSLWDMLKSYYPIYEIALSLQSLRAMAKVLRGSSSFSPNVSASEAQRFRDLLERLHRTCMDYSFIHTAELARCAIDRTSPETNAELFLELDHLNDSLGIELKREGVFRIPPERKDFFERDTLFGEEVAFAFPSCSRDIREAGSCYALGQGDGCVHHLMMVLERGLNALAIKLGVKYERTNWQNIIEMNASKLKVRGPESDFHREVNAQFGFLKDAYRNHSEHARDDYYDVPRARSALDCVSNFMRALEKGGLKE